MHIYGGNRSQGPSWVMAVAIVIILIVLLRSCTQNNRPLEQQFAAQPPAPGDGQIVLPPLPSSIADLAQTALARINGGTRGTALTPIAEGGSLRVTITSIRKTGSSLQINGSVTNIGTQPLLVGLGDFRFTDGSGTVYTADASTKTTLTSQQQAPLDLNLPIADPRQLVLDIQLPNQPPLHMVLIQAPE